MSAGHVALCPNTVTARELGETNQLKPQPPWAYFEILREMGRIGKRGRNNYHSWLSQRQPYVNLWVGEGVNLEIISVNHNQCKFAVFRGKPGQSQGCFPSILPLPSSNPDHSVDNLMGHSKLLREVTTNHHDEEAVKNSED